MESIMANFDRISAQCLFKVYGSSSVPLPYLLEILVFKYTAGTTPASLLQAAIVSIILPF